MADLSQTPANVKSGTSAITQVVQAGEAVSAGMPVYLKSTDGKYYKTDANDSAKYDVKGVALCGAGVDGYFVIQIGGQMNLGATTAAGLIYIVSATAGAIAPHTDLAAGWYPGVVGVGLDATGTILLICKSGSAPVATP